MVVNNAKLKHQDVELLVSTEFICLENITESIVDSDTRTGCQIKRKAPVFFRKIDYEDFCAQMSQSDRNAPMRALHIADAFARNVPKIRQKSTQNPPRLSNNSTRLVLRTTKRR